MTRRELEIRIEEILFERIGRPDDNPKNTMEGGIITLDDGLPCCCCCAGRHPDRINAYKIAKEIADLVAP